MVSMDGRLILVVLAVTTVATGEQTSHVSVKHGRSAHSFLHSSLHDIAPAGGFGKKHSWPKYSRTSPPVPHQPKLHTPPKLPEPAYPPLLPPTTPAPLYEVEPVYETTEPIYASPNTPAYKPTTPKYPVTVKSPTYTTNPPVYTTKPPLYGKPKPHDKTYQELPSCSYNTTKPWCLEDYEYPLYEIQEAAQKHPEKILALYADVADLSTAASVAGPPYTLEEETYICPSAIGYVRPLRAINSEGKWRVIVNNVKINYKKLTQTTRIEECLAYNEPCPLIPPCYQSTCLQKSVYHRFLAYDPYDLYFPFLIESFKIPASCACSIGEFQLNH